MLIYGQIPSNAMPTNSRPVGSFGGSQVFEDLPSHGAGDNPGVLVREKGRKVGQHRNMIADEFISVLTLNLSEICP